MSSADVEPPVAAASPVAAAAAATAAAGFNAASLTVGCLVVLRTIFGEEIRGTVFAHDPATACLLLREPGAHNGVATLRLLRSAFVRELVSAQQPAAHSVLDYADGLPAVCPEKCRRREERALAAAEQDAARVGVGVTKEAQMVFDALSKTMPCRWEGKAILVLEEVIVDEPYTADAALADKQHALTLQRVQKVINAERQRLGI